MFEPDISKIYQELRRILIEKNNLIIKTNTFNSEETLGISHDKFLSQYEIEDRFKKK